MEQYIENIIAAVLPHDEPIDGSNIKKMFEIIVAERDELYDQLMKVMVEKILLVHFENDLTALIRYLHESQFDLCSHGKYIKPDGSVGCDSMLHFLFSHRKHDEIELMSELGHVEYEKLESGTINELLILYIMWNGDKEKNIIPNAPTEFYELLSIYDINWNNITKEVTNRGFTDTTGLEQMIDKIENFM